MTCPALPADPRPQLLGKVSIRHLSVLQRFQPGSLGSFSSAQVMLRGGYEPLAVLCGGGLSPPGRPSVVRSELERQELPLSLRPWDGGWSRLGKTAAAVAGDEDSVRLCPLRPPGPRAAPSRALPPIAICSSRGSGCQRGLCAVAQVS